MLYLTTHSSTQHILFMIIWRWILVWDHLNSESGNLLSQLHDKETPGSNLLSIVLRFATHTFLSDCYTLNVKH